MGAKCGKLGEQEGRDLGVGMTVASWKSERYGGGKMWRLRSEKWCGCWPEKKEEKRGRVWYIGAYTQTFSPFFFFFFFFSISRGQMIWARLFVGGGSIKWINQVDQLVWVHNGDCCVTIPPGS